MVVRTSKRARRQAHSHNSLPSSTLERLYHYHVYRVLSYAASLTNIVVAKERAPCCLSFAFARFLPRRARVHVHGPRWTWASFISHFLSPRRFSKRPAAMPSAMQRWPPPIVM